MKINKSYLKKEILYRCSYSGTKETDILYDKLIVKKIDIFSFKELKLLKDLFHTHSYDEIHLILISLINFSFIKIYCICQIITLKCLQVFYPIIWRYCFSISISKGNFISIFITFK